MNNLCISSETYKLELNDIIALKDFESEYKNQNEVVILLRKNQPDCLLCGRSLAETAKKKNEVHIDVRVAFVSEIKPYDFVSMFVRPLRFKHQFWSSNVYHMSPFEIRRMKIERCFRDKNTAYTFTNPIYRRTDKERIERYEKLYESISKGYNDKYPVEIMPLRMLGVKDTVNNGHHRIAVALECGLDRIAINFKVIGKAPRLLAPIFRIAADLAIKLKQHKK